MNLGEGRSYPRVTADWPSRWSRAGTPHRTAVRSQQGAPVEGHAGRMEQGGGGGGGKGGGSGQQGGGGGGKGGGSGQQGGQRGCASTYRKHVLKHALANALPLARLGHVKVQDAQGVDLLHDSALILGRVWGGGGMGGGGWWGGRGCITLRPQGPQPHTPARLMGRQSPVTTRGTNAADTTWPWSRTLMKRCLGPTFSRPSNVTRSLLTARYLPAQAQQRHVDTASPLNPHRPTAVAPRDGAPRVPRWLGAARTSGGRWLPTSRWL
jgi:hypothetical protein